MSRQSGDGIVPSDFIHVTESEVQSAIKFLDPNKSADPDHLEPYF